MFKINKRQTIKQEFFFSSFYSALIISLVFIILISFATYYYNIQNTRQKLETSNIHASMHAKNVLECLAVSVKSNVGFQELIRSDSKAGIRDEYLLKIFEASKKANPNIIYAYAGFEDGSLLIEDYVPQKDYDATNRPWYIAAIENYPKVSMGLPYQEANTDEWLISVSKAMTDQEENLIGVMAIDCQLRYINEVMRKVIYFDTQNNYVLCKDGKIFVHDNEDYLHRPADDIVPGLTDKFNDESGIIRYDLYGETRLAYYQKLNEANWIVVSAINFSEIMNPIYIRLFLTILALVLLALLLGVGQVKFYAKRFVEPINALKNRISEITDERFVLISNNQYNYSNNELAQIAKQIEKMAKESLRKKANELNLILNSTSDAILVLDLDGNVIHSNRLFDNLWEDELKNELGLNYHLENIDMNERNIKFLELSKGTILEEYSCQVVEDEIVKGKLWRYRDVTKQFNTQKKLMKLATTDELTNISNRRYLMENGVMKINEAKKKDRPLSFLFIDIDRFKKINDKYGHLVGDEALKYLAKVLKLKTRKTDIVSRVGGEEFCILAPDTNIDEAYTMAQELRRHFEANTFIVDGIVLSFTVSIGISAINKENKGIDDLLSSSDKACYRAKENGRNCVVVH